MTDFTVTTSNDDAYDGGDLAAETADGGGLSLREAIGLANADADADTITFDASLSGSTLTLTGGELVISENVTIDGDIDGDNRADITIDANSASRVFNVSGGTSTLDSLTITGGNAADASGGGVLVASAATLTINDSTVSENVATASGGGIITFGDLTVTNSLIANNSAANDSGGIRVDGVSASLTITDSTVTNNTANFIGGILVISGGDATITNVTISGNNHTLSAFGSELTLYTGSSTATVSNSIIAGDGAPGNNISNEGTLTFAGTVLVNEAFSPTSGTATVDTLANIFDDTITGSNGATGGELADNGDTVQSMAISVSGPADNAGSDGENVGSGPDNNAAAVIGGNTTQSVGEDETGTVGGTLTASDVDNADDTFTAATVAGDYGSLTIGVGGDYTYDLTEANSAVQALNTMDTLTDTIEVTSVDGTTQDIVITINGANDAAVVTGTIAGSVTEGNVGDATVTASGTPVISDVDADDTPSFADTMSAAGDNGFGSFVLTSGTWTYTLDQSAAGVQALNATDTLTDTHTFTATDGTTQLVTVTINGANDAATIGGNTTQSVGEDATGTVGGTLTASDVDNADDSFTAETVAGTYGSLTIAANGVYTYDLTEANATVQNLSDGETLTDTIEVMSVDGTTQDITVTINGADDILNLIVTTANDDAYGGGTLAEETADGGGLSLREALAFTNADTDADTISFDASLSGSTITLAGEELLISSSVTIDGDIDGDNRADITIDAYGSSRVFNVTGGTSTLDSLTVTGGNVSGSGGGINVDTTADLTVANSTISGNSVFGGSGGGIFSTGTLTLTNSLITGNAAGSQGGGIFVRGSTTISSSTITANSAPNTGGIWVGGGTTTITGSTISGNSQSASSFGEQLASFGTTTVTDSIIAGEGGNGLDIGGNVTFVGTVLTTEAFSPSSGTATVSTSAEIFDATTSMAVTVGVLANNGGEVDTIAISTGGAADGTGTATGNVGGDVGQGAFGNNAPDQPTLNGSSVDENDAGALIGTLTSFDPDGETVTFSVVGDDRFIVDGTQLRLRDDFSFNFESEESVEITVRASDIHGSSSGTSEQTFVITVIDVDESSVLTGNDDSEALVGGDDDDLVTGGGGGDNINGGKGNDTLFGGNGDDVASGGNGNDTVDGGEGADTVTGGGGDDSVSGGTGNDNVDGGAGNDTLRGGAGDDDVLGGSGDDVVAGGSGNDDLEGGEGADTIDGGDGNDTITGGRDDDLLRGGDGSDSLDGGTSNDTLNGGEGDDTLTGGGGTNILWSGNGDDIATGGDGNDLIGGMGGNDLLNGGGGNDTLFGAAGDDTLNGGTGNDVIFTGTGNDLVDGGEGNDIIWAGQGNDTLTGGDGEDTFCFGATSGTDTITDFDTSEDTLNLLNTVRNFTSSADVTNAATATSQNGVDGLVIDLGGGNSVFLVDVGLADIGAIDFGFSV